MNIGQTAKIIHKVAAGWSTFRFWSLSDDHQKSIVAAWHSILGKQEVANVERIVDRKLAQAERGQDAKWEAAPDAKDILRELTTQFKAKSFWRADNEFKSDYAKTQLRMGLVPCVFKDKTGKLVQKWEKKHDAIHDGINWTPKIEFILRYLDHSYVNKIYHAFVRADGQSGVSALIKRVGDKTESGKKFWRDYDALRERLLDEAIDVSTKLTRDARQCAD